ncbi:MAG: 3-deoxy-7-phosphoheptulonate synthase, partial [Spirochaetales bacterium]|nr:3-deoxy-7-phosphoheptulonate synthase [Spirochaetales bacterium]
MIVVLQKHITEIQKDSIRKFLKDRGFQVREIVGEEEVIFGAVGKSTIDLRSVEVLEGVDKVIPISRPYKLASRELKKEDTVVRVGPIKLGGNRVAVIAGPCAVESRERMLEIARVVADAGAVMLRGGAFKPRTSPYSFQGLGETGLKYLKEAGESVGLPVASEIVSHEYVDMMLDYVDVYQIGARNMQNFELLKAVGKTGRPVILKRGLAATIEEWLMAAEYLMAHGNDNVILCERGIRTFERYTRNTLDISAIPVVKKLSHLPVIVDPSHGTGLRGKVLPMALAAVAAGADGVMVEVHTEPDKAFSDGPQSLYPEQFEILMRDIEALLPVVGKSLETVPIRLYSSSALKGSEKATGAAVFGTAAAAKAAFQGVHGAYSEAALGGFFGGDVEAVPCHSFRDVFSSVIHGNTAYGVIPVENSLAGTINDNFDLLLSHPDITVIGEQQFRIIHNLIGFKETKTEDIRRVFSHPQGLAQCADFLDRYPQIEQVPFFDTAGAVAHVKKNNDPASAAIAGAQTAAYYGLSILREGIETNPRNYTRFYIITREDFFEKIAGGKEPNRSVMVFSTPDKPGALFTALKILADHGLNMKKLESRPIPGKPWEYMFFVETEISSIEEFSSAVNKLKKICETFRVLGTF